MNRVTPPVFHMRFWRAHGLLHLEVMVLIMYVNFNTLRTGDADLRFYITTVQDG